MRRLQRLLSEAFMGLLALLALAAALVPLLFKVTPSTRALLDVAEWGIVALFALEYAVNLSLAEDKRVFVLDSWRLLDLVVVVAPLASLLPFVTDAARSSPALRMLRLFRAIVFGARAGGSLRRRPLAAGAAPAGPPLVTLLRPTDATPSKIDWSRLLAWAANPGSDWIHASNVEPGLIEELARVTGVPQPLVQASLSDSAFPRLESAPPWAMLSLSLLASAGSDHRVPVLVLATTDDVLTLCRHPIDLHDLRAIPPFLASLPWGPRIVLFLIRHLLSRHEELAARHERDLRSLEQTPADESSEAFFERTFEMKKSLSAARADLFRLRHILSGLASGRRQLPGVAPSHRELLETLADDAELLHDTVDAIRESLLSLIDLHLNIAAHETNRFMRVLAVVSALALIPSIAGGVLGMNLIDSPWPLTIAQVGFCTFFAMVLVLYGFMAKGWLR